MKTYFILINLALLASLSSLDWTRRGIYASTDKNRNNNQGCFCQVTTHFGAKLLCFLTVIEGCKEP